MPGHTKVASPPISVSLLFDVVVFAGGTAPGLSPLCNNEPKPMLSICNRPMIWYCLSPWILAGCRTFFLCVNEDYATLQSYLRREIPYVEFIFVMVPLTQNETPSTTCDALKAYLKHKESLKPEKTGEPRDALLLSCDTLLPGVDLEYFISNFYSSVSAVSALLFRPIPAAARAAAASPSNFSAKSGGGGKDGSGGGSGGGGGNVFHAKPYTYRFTCAAYEETPAVESNEKSPDDGSAENGVHHHRLHFLCPYEDSPAPRITHGFTGRRPNLTFSADTVDVHAYLVRDWVLRVIADSAEEGMTLQRDSIPFLARSQHSTLNAEQGMFLRPDAKIKATIPRHWMFDGEGSIVQQLNAVQGSRLPVEADNLLVSCTIYEEQEDRQMRMYRVKTRDDFVAVTHEILAAKCQMLNLAQAPVPNSTNSNSTTTKAANTKQPHQKEQQQQQQLNSPQVKIHSKIEQTVSAELPSSLLALADLLPDSPFTLIEKIGTQQVQIRCSFIKSVPTGNAFITRSIIGSNVTLGANVRITNSVILDNVEIGANAIITSSVIGSSAMVNPKVRVVNCTVAPQSLVESDETDSVVRA